MCVIDGGGDVGCSRGGRESGRHPPPSPSPPWNETAVDGTSLGEKLG